MKQDNLNKAFWEGLYDIGDTGWDLGSVSPPIKAYADQLKSKDQRILIPGCGRGYEAEYLHKQGFTNVNILDITSKPLEEFRKRVLDFPENCLINEDFFQHKGRYDLIFEQTFFCAIDPSRRIEYSTQIHQLLVPCGKLVGLMFDHPLNDDKPPYGGNASVYRPIFEELFRIDKMEPCYNSVKPRLGRELFCILSRKE